MQLGIHDDGASIDVDFVSISYKFDCVLLAAECNVDFWQNFATAFTHTLKVATREKKKSK